MEEKVVGERRLWLITKESVAIKNDKELSAVQKNKELVPIPKNTDGGNGCESSKGRNDEKEEDDDTIPKKGMKFKSKEDVQEFYNRYAQQVGFGTKIRGTWKNDRGEVNRHILACVREGKCDPTKERKYTRRITSRCNCKAQITARVMEDGFWYLTSVNLEHNHLVSPSMIRFFRNSRKSNGRVKKQLELNDQVGCSNSKSFVAFAKNAGAFRKKDARNLGEGPKRLKLGDGDAEAICLFFMHCQKQNSNFFHLMDIDDEGCLRNVFWADARSRASYHYFSDVVSFETTYSSNKYSMPLVLFIGVNHHGQSVLLGCGLLSSETPESYEWLFSTLLTCMSGKPPNAIITDQCPSIQEAVSKVFPAARHRFCVWHIMKKAPEKLKAHKDWEQIVWMLKNAVYGSLRFEEFEQRWGEVIEKFGLQENEWLKTLFEIRHKWVPSYVKENFWAGMSTIQPCESMATFFDGYVNSKTTLKQFLIQYEVALSKKYEKEALADFNSFHKEQELVSRLPYENQLRTVYTNDLFSMFQEEVRNMMNCRVKLLAENGPLSKYEVKDRISHSGVFGQDVKNFEVWFHAEEVQVLCICRLFEFQGILCSHAMCVLDYNDITELPSRYIVARWRKDFKRLHTPENPFGDVNDFDCGPIARYNDLYMQCHKIAEIGSMSDEMFRQTLIGIKDLEQRLFSVVEKNKNIVKVGVPKLA